MTVKYKEKTKEKKALPELLMAQCSPELNAGIP